MRVVLAALLATWPIVVSATTWNVFPDGSGDVPTIQAAMDLAAPGDTVLLGPGTYRDLVSRPLAGGDANSVVFLTHGVVLQSTGGPEVTFLDGENDHHCLVGESLGPTTVVRGITLLDGLSSGSGGNDIWGGGMLVFDCAALVELCHFVGCSAGNAGAGGGILVFGDFLGAGPTIRLCVFRDNSAGLGGAVEIFRTDPFLVERCTFARNNSTGHAGAIVGNTSTGRVDNCVFWNNQAARGGAMSCINSADVVGSCNLFWENQADNDPDVFSCSIVVGQDGNLVADPLFCDAAQNDFGLQPGSPASPPQSGSCGQIGAFPTCGPTVFATLLTDPSGLRVKLDGIEVETPFTTNMAVDSTHVVTAFTQTDSLGQYEYSFSSWSDGGAEQHAIVVPDSAFSLTAFYDINPRQGVLLDTDPSGLLFRADSVEYRSPVFFEWDLGQAHVVSAVTPQDEDATTAYAFTAWSDGGDTTHTVVVPPPPYSIVASYALEQKIAVTVGSSPPGLVILADGVPITPFVHLWARGSAHVLDAVSPQSLGPGLEYTFSSWSDGGAQLHTFVVPDSAISLTAFYDLTPGLLVDTAPSGLLFRVDGTEFTSPVFFESSVGTQYAVEAITPQDRTAASVHAFSNWSDGGDTTHTVTVLPPPHVVVADFFVENKVPVTLDSSPPGLQVRADSLLATTPFSQFWGRGSAHVVDAISPQSGGAGRLYVFASWSDGGEQVHTIIGPSAPVTYTAAFDLVILDGTVVDTDPSGLAIGVDGAPYGTPTFFVWAEGTVHILTALTGHLPGGGTFDFVSWADGTTSNPRTVIQGPGQDSYTAQMVASNFIQAEVVTNPPGQRLRVDGVEYEAPARVLWTIGSRHTLEVDSLLFPDPGVRLIPIGERVREVVAPMTDQVYTFDFDTEYFVTMNSEPGGTVSPDSDWHPAGAAIEIAGTADPRFYFAGWVGAGDGSFTGPTNPVSITADGPVTERGRFGQVSYELSLSLSGTNPFVNTGPPAALQDIFLWLVCGTDGMNFVEAKPQGTMAVAGFVPAPGILNAGSGAEIELLAVDCLTTRTLLGKFVVTSDAQLGGDLCLVPRTNGRLAAGDCTPFGQQAYLWPADLKVSGVNTAGGTFCTSGRGCGEIDLPIPVLLSGLEVRETEGAVEVTWSTSVESFHDGFHVYRSLVRDRGYHRLNRDVIRGASPYLYRDPSIEAATTYWYKIGAVDIEGREAFHGPVTIRTAERAVFTLATSRPNPFRHRTVIPFSLASEGLVRLGVFDVGGRRVVSLVDARLAAGEHRVPWEGRDGVGRRLPAGVYFLRLVASDTKTRKIVLLGPD